MFQLIATSTASSIVAANENNNDIDGSCLKSIDAAMVLINSTVVDKVTGTFAQDQQQHDNMLM